MTRDHIPARMLRRPQDARGLPIPFSQFIRADGTPDFRVLDVMKVRQCVSQRRCGMCGEIMGRHIFFIGGPLCVANGVFNDPPMHRECAVFALAACAHLNRTKGKYNTAAPLPTDAVTMVATLCSDEKAEHFALMHSTGYQVGRGSDGMIYIRANLPWLDVELWRDGAPMRQQPEAS
jgi:hypothetical protein